MNQWIIQSIKLANSHGYLDNLYQVYPIKRSGKRPLDKELRCNPYVTTAHVYFVVCKTIESEAQRVSVGID